MFESKYHVRAFILTVLLWHGLSWFGTTQAGPSDAAFRLTDLWKLGVHAIQVFFILMIYKAFASSADLKHFEDEQRAMLDAERQMKEWREGRENAKLGDQKAQKD